VRTTTYQYDTNDLDLVKITNPLGVQVSSNWFNSSHHVLTNYNAFDEKTVWYYNARQQIAGVQHPSGLITTNYYNTWNQLDTTIDFAVSGTNTIYYRTNTYDYATNLVASHTDERGRYTTYYYDKLQRLIKEIDERGTNIYVYDKLDLIQTVDRMGHTNSFGYDRIRRKVAETNALGTVTGYSYCLCGSPDYVTNAVGTDLQQIIQYGYDTQGRLLSVAYPDSSGFTYSYHSLGKVTKVVDSSGVRVTNYYNNQGIQVATSNYFGRLQAITYDTLD